MIQKKGSFVKKYLIFFCSLFISLSPAASEFHCSGQGLDIRKEKERSYFGFYVDKRLVAFRHLETQVRGESYILTNRYDLEIILLKNEESTYEGSLKGKLTGKRIELSLECEGKL
jgi:hypothetical protein